MRASRGLKWENKMYKLKRSIEYGKRKRRFRHLKGLVKHSFGMREHKSKACKGTKRLKFKSKLRKIEPQILVQAAFTKWEREPGFEVEVVTQSEARE